MTCSSPTDCAAHWVNTQHLPIEQSRSASSHKRDCVKKHLEPLFPGWKDLSGLDLNYLVQHGAAQWLKATFTQKQTHRDERQHTLFSLKCSWLCCANKISKHCKHQFIMVPYIRRSSLYWIHKMKPDISAFFADFCFYETAPQQSRPSKVRRHSHTYYSDAHTLAGTRTVFVQAKLVNFFFFFFLKFRLIWNRRRWDVLGEQSGVELHAV